MGTRSAVLFQRKRRGSFKVAYLTDEQVNMFTSDFRVVADYFVQKRKTRSYVPDRAVIRHVNEVLKLFSMLEQDSRFTEAGEWASEA